jgi:hypothetical protein
MKANARNAEKLTAAPLKAAPLSVTATNIVQFAVLK